MIDDIPIPVSRSWFPVDGSGPRLVLPYVNYKGNFIIIIILIDYT